MSDEEEDIKLKYAVRNLADIDVSKIPQRDFLLRDCYGNGICQRDQVSITGGHGGGGKSAMSVGMGVAWHQGCRSGRGCQSKHTAS